MATGDYCTLTELKARLWPSSQTPDSTDDAILQAIITATSRAIDKLAARRFYTTSADETRYYPSMYSELLYIPDDIISITTLATDADGDGTYEDTWTATDYILCPVNAALDSLPYTWIEVNPNGNYSFPSGSGEYQKSVKVIGKFGYAATVPGPIKQAALIQAMRLYKRIDSPMGIVSNPAGGEMRLLADLDPDVSLLIAPYRRIQ